MNVHGITIEEAFGSIHHAFNTPSTTIAEDLAVLGVAVLIIIGLVVANKLQS